MLDDVLDLEIPFGLITSPTDDGFVVTIVGELDMSTAPGLNRALASLAEQGVRRLTLDLAGLAFIDARGITVLVSALKRQHEIGGELILRGPRPTALKVLELTGLTTFFTITESAPDRTLSSSGTR